MKKPPGLLSGLTLGLAAGLLLLQLGQPPAIPGSAHSEKAQEQPEEALEALQFLSASAAFPGNDIPADGYARAWTYYRQHYLTSKNRMAGGGSGWESLGPTNVGGRTLSLAIHPTDTSTLWMGSASGGLWKSTSGGLGANAWTYIPTGFPTLGVSSIALHPTDPNTIYIGTGETYYYGSPFYGLVDRTTRGTFGIGILKSTNGGLTWTPALDWQYEQQRGVWEILIDQQNPATLYAATTEGVYKSVDQGGTWALVLNQKMVMDLAMDPSDPAILYAGVGNLGSTGKGVYKTTDGGTTWTRILPSSTGGPSFTTYGRITLAICPDDPGKIAAHVCDDFLTYALFRSADKGATWTTATTQNIGSYQGWFSKGLVYKPGAPNTLLAAGVEVFRSVNNGTSFAQISNTAGNLNAVHPDVHDIILNPLDPNKVYVLTDGGLYRSNNFGNSFFSCNDGYVTTQCYIGSVSQQDSTLGLAGLQDNFTQRYDGSPSWTNVLGGDGTYNAIHPLNDNVQYASSQYLYLNRSNDRGQTFYQYAAPPALNFPAFIAPFRLAPSQPARLYAGDLFLNRSDNNGNTWQAFGPASGFDTPILTLAASATNADTVYFALTPDSTHSMQLYRSADGGSTYTDITGPLPNRYPRAITVNPHDSREVYAVFSGFGSGHIFKSSRCWHHLDRYQHFPS